MVNEQNPNTSASIKGQPKFRTFVLRCWQETNLQSEDSEWRFSLEDIQAKDRLGIHSTPKLIQKIQSLFPDVSEVGRPVQSS